LGEKPKGAEMHRRALLHELDDAHARIRHLESVVNVTSAEAQQWRDTVLDYENRVSQAYLYVNEPGNWSALDTRRRTLLNILTGRGNP